MNKFERMLSASNQDVLSARSKALSQETVLEAESLIQSLKREKLQLENKITNLTDLAPENSYSLKPGSPSFNASSWIKELHKLRLDVKLKEIELTEAEEIFNEWFNTSK